MVKQKISKFLRQMKFMRKTRADEIDQEESQRGPLPASSDEYWVLDIPGLDKLPDPDPGLSAQPQPISHSYSYSSCIPMQFGRMSANGQNKDLEVMLEKKQEAEKMKEMERITSDVLLTEEEMIETYLSLARKTYKSQGQHKESAPPSTPSKNEDDEKRSADEPVKSFRKHNNSFGRVSTGTPRGKVSKRPVSRINTTPGRGTARRVNLNGTPRGRGGMKGGSGRGKFNAFVNTARSMLGKHKKF